MANSAGADPAAATNSSSNKRRKVGEHQDDESKDSERPLIPGLPDHIAQTCLSHVKKPSLLYSVCHSWRRLLYSPSFPPSLSLYTLLSPTTTLAATNLNCNNNHNNDTDYLDNDVINGDHVRFFCYDPLSSKWDPLPPPPPADPPLRLLLRHPSFISRHLPVQSLSVSGRLVLLAATTHNLAPALSRPLLFNPISASWSHGPLLAAPRRWCAAGSSRSSVYVASGIGSQFSTNVSKSMEKWDLNDRNSNKKSKNIINNIDKGISYCNGNDYTSSSDWKWEKMRGMKDGRFSREAITAIGWRGKLCMVNVEGDAVKEGVIYDVEHDEWLEMPVGMLAGWKGPAVSVKEEVMYVVDESRGVLRKYDEVRDDWVDVVASSLLRGASHVEYGGGRICVVCGGGTGIVVVDVMAVPVKLVIVDVPVGFEALAVHVLPRMCRPDFQ